MRNPGKGEDPSKIAGEREIMEELREGVEYDEFDLNEMLGMDDEGVDDFFSE